MIFRLPLIMNAPRARYSPEAGVLNQTLAENVRNNMSASIKKSVDEGTFDQAGTQALIDEYIEGYVFGVRRGRGPADPVEREALVIAKEEVRRALRRQGYKLGDVDVSSINRLAEEVIEKNPAITSEAERRVKQRQGLVEDIDLTNLGAVDEGDEQEEAVA